MHWLYTSFQDYCRKHGIQLLRDDLRFIEKQLQKIPENRHKRVMKDYFDKWLNTIKESQNAPQSQNLGRRNANIWLNETLNG